jgi:hypothetical protein
MVSDIQGHEMVKGPLTFQMTVDNPHPTHDTT